MNKQKEEAHSALDAVHYKGEWSNFTNILTKAYNALQQLW
jgi:hypothetical protein